MSLFSDFPENHGLSTQALIELFAQTEQRDLQVNSFMLLQDGKVTAEYWREPYRKDTPQLLYSLSKSFTSIAVGIAWDKGLLELDEPVISFFPDKLPATVSPNLARMTIRHLLSMTAGHDFNLYSAVAAEQDWVAAFLAQEVALEPGTHYLYSTHSTYMLSAIIERVTGQSLVDFLMPALFEPLGIPRPVWETCPLGITAGGMGLSLTTESVAKFGQMLLNSGVYGKNRIVSERYLELATTEQSDNRIANAGKIDSMQGYGYQFHLCRRGCYRGDGSFGQMCFVAPKEKLVIAMTASFSNMRELQLMLDLIYEHIFDRLENKELPVSAPASDMLQQQLSRLSRLHIPVAMPIPGDAILLLNRRYELADNPCGLQELAFVEGNDGQQMELQLIFKDSKRNTRLPYSFAGPVYSKSVFTKDLADHEQTVVAYAAWETGRRLKLTLYYIETPYIVTYTLGFPDDSSIELQFRIHVSLDIPDFTAEGTRSPFSLPISG
ncbi:MULTISPECIES: serine hydrolase [unclassified Paenibacillus]|uniref:serine hydrolase domain-containing protein n=1 Tax=unclassified Paenibacillus TaxID=185978 RepID=UPI001046C2F4|nr:MULTISPECIES: serine hydrolase [unclassified Paenibacillus]NIK70655.1 CubicO group peptidase (beta-lactamase class C family) [Paenibacillus sp. BK720]TCM86435.1 CubicO group peptidase (beta-lactamase class C family) [Paenibacillus sp. BK033]